MLSNCVLREGVCGRPQAVEATEAPWTEPWRLPICHSPHSMRGGQHGDERSSDVRTTSFWITGQCPQGNVSLPDMLG